METKISNAINAYANKHCMSALRHQWIQYNQKHKRGWAGCYADKHKITQIITLCLFGEGNTISVYGAEPDNSKSIYYCTVTIK